MMVGQLQQTSPEIDHGEAKRYAESLLLERSRCYSRIRSIDRELIKLGIRYGICVDLYEILIQDGNLPDLAFE
jgi:hypothetical protein